MISPENNLDEAMHKLFTAKWNIPQATAALGKVANKENWQHTMELFREYCKSHPVTFEAELTPAADKKG